MPDVVGKDLDTATGKLDSAGIQYAVNSSGKHVILKFDWGRLLDVSGRGSARNRDGDLDRWPPHLRGLRHLGCIPSMCDS
jgi:hypothetical protein